MSGASESVFVTVAAVYSRVELTFLLGLLRGHGFWVVAVGERHHHVEWPLAVALGGVELRVLAADAADARALLATYDREPFRGGIYTSDRFVDIALALILCFFFGVPPPARIPAHFFLEERL